MQVEELRVGNWVYIEGSKPQKVYVVRYWEINYDDSDAIKPIPLTEEILLKCGAKHWRNPTYYVFETPYSPNIEFQPGDVCNYEHIKNLHQLQNLYFALTGKELNVEL